LFCLVADVRIRERTRNRKGLQDALRGILNAGGNIEAAVQVDLPALWKRLGIEVHGRNVVFDDQTPLAAVRPAIIAGS